MNMAERLKGAGMGLVVCIACAPLAAIIAIALLPLWDWVEVTFGSESVGHSGPAGWCYLTTYIVVLICAGIVWRGIINKGKGQRGSNMKYEADIFVAQVNIVEDFIYHMTYYRELLAEYNKNNLKSEFWTYTIDAHLSLACIKWCMVFGADGNPTHWKKLSNKDRRELEDNFRKGCYTHTGLKQKDYQKYWDDMTEFRNKYVAHRESYSRKVPYFDKALQVAYYYDSWVRNLIAPDVLEEPPLQEKGSNLQAQITPLIVELMNQTKEYNQGNTKIT